MINTLDYPEPIRVEQLVEIQPSMPKVLPFAWEITNVCTIFAINLTATGKLLTNQRPGDYRARPIKNSLLSLRSNQYVVQWGCINASGEWTYEQADNAFLYAWPSHHRYWGIIGVLFCFVMLSFIRFHVHFLFNQLLQSKALNKLRTNFHDSLILIEWSMSADNIGWHEP